MVSILRGKDVLESNNVYNVQVNREVMSEAGSNGQASENGNNKGISIEKIFSAPYFPPIQRRFAEALGDGDYMTARKILEDLPRTPGMEGAVERTKVQLEGYRALFDWICPAIPNLERFGYDREKDGSPDDFIRDQFKGLRGYDALARTLFGTEEASKLTRKDVARRIIESVKRLEKFEEIGDVDTLRRVQESLRD